MCITSTPYRSVNDYQNEEDLMEALEKLAINNSQQGDRAVDEDDEASCVCAANDSIVHMKSREGIDSDDGRDWVIPNADAGTSISQNVQHELRRLVVLKSYYALDMNEEARKPFMMLVRLLRKCMKCEHAFIDLVDMGRTQLFATTFQDEVMDIPRRDTVCAHWIVSTEEICSVSDCSADKRYKDLPGVTALGVRFAAGMPLITDNGFRIGIVGVFDSKPRRGLSDEEIEMMTEIRDLSMDSLVKNRTLSWQHERLETSSKRLLSAAHDLLTPLTGVELSLSMLAGDVDFNTRLSASQLESFTTAATCTRVIKDICETLRRVPREHALASGTNHKASTTTGENKSRKQPDFASMLRVPNAFAEDAATGICQTRPLLHQRLVAVSTALSKRVPIVTFVEDSVPRNVVTDEIKVFRSLVILTAKACERAETGEIKVSLTVRTMENSEPFLHFQVDFQGLRILPEDQESLFEETSCLASAINKCNVDACKTFLRSISHQIKSLQGNYGAHAHSSDHDTLVTNVMWFNIPLLVPEEAPETERAVRQNRRKRCCDDMMSECNDSSIGSGSTDCTSSVTDSVASSTESPCIQLPQQEQQQHEESQSVAQETSVDDLEVAMITTKEVSSVVHAAPTVTTLTSIVPKALVIDDSLVVRKMLTRALSKLGYETMQANDGMQGLECLQKHQFDLTLCDFLMPVMDGMDCVREYRKWERDQHLQANGAYGGKRIHQYIVGISAHASPKDIERGLGLGMDAFRPKPLLFNELKVLQSHAQLFNSAWKLEQELPGRSSPTPVSSRSSHRRTLSGGLNADGPPKCVCLIATEDEGSSAFFRSMGDELGWKTVVADNSNEAMRLLKKRNWGVVLLDTGLQGMDGIECVAKFRQWEQQNRVHRQGNLHLLGPCKDVTKPVAPTTDTQTEQQPIIQQQKYHKSHHLLPDGSIDGVLSKPVSRESLANIFLRAVAGESALHALNIVSR